MSKKSDAQTDADAERAWLQILSWLPPEGIACMACTSRFFRRVCEILTVYRAADLSRGWEKYPVPASNSFDAVPYPYFTYTSSSFPATISPKLQPWGPYSAANFPYSGGPADAGILKCSGCNCTECYENCPCRESGLYANHGEEISSDIDMHYVEDFLLVVECGPACLCSSSCRYRVTQKGLGFRVKVTKHPDKGWSLYSLEPAGTGAFVCEYAGELLTTAYARDRQRRYDETSLRRRNFSSSLMVIREHLPSRRSCLRINVDATVIGNVARFINHSCDGGNLLPVVVRCSGSIIPRLCFFTKRGISEGDELTFSYGSSADQSSLRSCFCKTSACLGSLPSEPT